jgi:hypothetical protein
MSQGFSCGYVHLPDEVEQVCEDLRRLGNEPVFASARPEISGFWQREKARGVTGIFLWEWEQKFLGKLLPSDAQWSPPDPGTCAARSGYRAIQDSLGTACLNGRILGKPTQLAYEAAYGGGRVAIGQGRLGYDGGMVLGWFARWVRERGILPRGVYGQYDLTRSRPELAEAWGQPRMGPPAEIEAASRAHPVPACYLVPSVTALADALAARFAGHCGSATKFGGRNAAGEARVEQLNYHHAEEWCGVYVRPDGATGFVRQDSHGDQAHAGRNEADGPVLETAGGPVRLRLGSYGVHERDVLPLFSQGENWMYAPPETFRPVTLSEVT